MNKVDYVLRIIRNVCPHVYIEAETELIDSGILTSLVLFDLIAELETELDYRIPEELILTKNFATAETITNIVLRGVEF